MVTLLRRLFIKDYKDIKNPIIRKKHIELASFFGLFINIVLIVLKFTAAILMWQITKIFSGALLADALNNTTDLVTSLINIISNKLSEKPADKEHPFGHKRIEYIASLIISVIVLVLGAQLLQESITNAVSLVTNHYTLLTIIILAVSIFLKLVQGYMYRSISKLTSSSPLKASSIDSISDSFSTTLILIGAIISYTINFDYLDPYMGLVGSLFLIFNGLKLTKESATPLIGERIDTEVVKQILKEAKEYPGILGIHDILAHNYGPNKFFISFHAEIDAKLPLLEAHDIVDSLEKELKEKYHYDVTIHLDPITTGDEETEHCKALISKTLHAFDPSLSFHDFRLVKGVSHTNVIFDVLIPYESKSKEDEIKQVVLDCLKGHTPPYDVVINFDRPY